MITLYFNPFTRATRPRWLLEELGVPYELVHVDLRAGEHKRPDYLALHPHGRLPVLVDGELTVFESAAICLYLADRYGLGRLAPPVDSPERGRYFQWVIYGMATLEVPVYQVFRHTRLPEEDRKPEEITAAHLQFAECARVLTDALGDREFLLGDQFSAADVVVGSIVIWAGSMGMLDDLPVLQRYADRLKARPAQQKSRAKA